MAASGPSSKPATARVGKNNRAQIVTIPLAFRFPEEVRVVYVRKDGDDVILSPRPPDWTAYFRSRLRTSADFMQGVEDLPVQERDG